MSTCSSCGAAIKWVRMTSVKTMPLDAQPADDGNIVEGDDGLFAVGVRIRKSDRPRYRSHFSSCPNAARHRKPREQSE
jgi:hypothetical protein